jgi:hypothetical protein
VDPEAFTRAVEAELQLRRAPFERRAVIGFCQDVWPLVLADGEDPAVWAGLFLEAGHAGPSPTHTPTADLPSPLRPG